MDRKTLRKYAIALSGAADFFRILYILLIIFGLFKCINFFENTTVTLFVSAVYTILAGALYWWTRNQLRLLTAPQKKKKVAAKAKPPLTNKGTP